MSFKRPFRGKHPNPIQQAACLLAGDPSLLTLLHLRDGLGSFPHTCVGIEVHGSEREWKALLARILSGLVSSRPQLHYR